MLFEIYEDMVQILLMLKVHVLFKQNSEVEDLFCGASSGSEPSLFKLKQICNNLEHYCNIVDLDMYY